MLRKAFALAALLAAVPATANADVNAVASGSTTSTGNIVSFQFNVPAGNERLLAVGIGTTEGTTVSSVLFGPQVLTREVQAAEFGMRSEIWLLQAPNVGSAMVTVTLSGLAPSIVGATTFVGVDQTAPVKVSTGQTQNSASNSASIVLNGTVVADGMFGTIAVGNAANTGPIATSASTDTVTAGQHWSLTAGGLRGAGASRRGNTGQNMALNAGISYLWPRIDSQQLNPFAQTIVALRTSGSPTPPSVSSPTASAITHNSATLGGTLTATGGSTITQRGVVYCACPSPVLGGPGVSVANAGPSDTLGPFTVNVSGLNPSTGYSYRAYASNALGVAYSGAIPFVTAPLPNLPPTAGAGGPYTVNEGASLQLIGSGTDPEGAAVTFSWDLNGDGTFGDATGRNPALSFAQLVALGLGDGPSTAQVRVRVSDGVNEVTSAQTTLTIVNVPPTATLTNGGQVDEGSSGQVSFIGASDPSPSDTEFRYAYDFDSDGTWDLGGLTFATASTAASVTVPASYLGDGFREHTVRGAILDKDGASRTYLTTISVRNVPPTATLQSQTVTEGSTVTVGLTDVDDVSAADRASLRYAYDLDGDGTYEIGSLTYADATAATTATMPAALTADGPATRTVYAAVIDKDGAATVHIATVTVTNVAPSATFANGGAVAEGQAGEVSFSGASDPSPADTEFRYAYDFDDDGTWDVGGATFATASPSATVAVPAAFLPDGPGSRVVRGAILDKDSGLRSYTTTITITNAAPTAAFADQTVDEGAATTIALSDVADAAADAASLRYGYDFDDDGVYDVGSATYATASTAESAAVPAALVADGPATRTMRIAVLDKDGGANSYTATLTVANVAPDGTLGNDGDVDEGGTARVSWTGVTDPSPADTAAGVRYAYDFDDDGTWEIGDTDAAAVDVPASFTADGDTTLTVRAAVIDKDGGRREHTTSLDVANVAPTATLHGATVDEGSPATVAFSDQADASAADVAAGFTYEYDFDDDGTFEGGGASATLPAALTADGPATLTVRAAIIDRDGARTEYDATVTVENVAPTVDVSGPEAVPSSGAVALEVALDDPSASDPVSATIDWGDGATATIADRGTHTVAHTYGAPGAYTVRIAATDGSATTTATHAVTVAAAPAAPAPEVVPAAAKLRITGLRVTPRCIRAPSLRAVTSARKTLTVRLRLSEPATVRFQLERWNAKRGASKCPPATGVAKRGGRKVPGVYRPFSARGVTAKAGLNTIRLAATGRKGKLLRPGTYLLRVTAGDVNARTKLWVLANR